MAYGSAVKYGWITVELALAVAVLRLLVNSTLGAKNPYLYSSITPPGTATGACGGVPRGSAYVYRIAAQMVNVTALLGALLTTRPVPSTDSYTHLAKKSPLATVGVYVALCE